MEYPGLFDYVFTDDMFVATFPKELQPAFENAVKGTSLDGIQEEQIENTIKISVYKEPQVKQSLKADFSPIIVMPVAACVLGVTISPSTTICSGTAPTITLTCNKNKPTFSWTVSQSGVSGASAGNTGRTSTPYTMPAQTLTYTSNPGTVTYTFSVNSPGCSTSTQQTITVLPVVTASVSIAASANPVCAGASVTFTAAPTNGGAGPTYQWKKNGVNVGTNSAVYTNAALNNNDVITCVLTSNATCVTGSPATSNAITMTVNPVVTASVSIAASANPVCAGASVTFTATPTNGGAGPTYQWKKNGANVGTNSAVYTNAALNNNDVITCVLTSNATCVTGNPATSNAITMTINLLPSIEITPSGTNAQVALGQSITLTASGALTYAWSEGSSDIGTGGASITVSPIKTTIYTVTGINEYDCMRTVQVEIIVIGQTSLSLSEYMSGATDDNALVFDASFSKNGRLKESDIHALFGSGFPNNCPNIKKFDFSGQDAGDAFLNVLNQSNLSIIQTLDLSSNNLSQIAQNNLDQLTQLKKLKINHNQGPITIENPFPKNFKQEISLQINKNQGKVTLAAGFSNVTSMHIDASQNKELEIVLLGSTSDKDIWFNFTHSNVVLNANTLCNITAQNRIMFDFRESKILSITQPVFQNILAKTIFYGPDRDGMLTSILPAHAIKIGAPYAL